MPDPIFLALDPLADPGPHGAALEAVPASFEGVAKVVQGLMMHEHWAGTYGQELTPERRGESQLRSVRAMLDRASKDDPRPLTEARGADTRIVGVCRHFTQLAVALLRLKGIPARARCGFGRYFFAGVMVDHWVVEYWDGSSWKLGDAQLDAVQLGALKPAFDPADVPRDEFVIAGRAWKDAREGKADPLDYGIFEMRGLWFIGGNLVRDAAALMNAPMLPWDVWGGMPEPPEGNQMQNGHLPPEMVSWLDRLAELTTEPDAHLAELKRLYAADQRLTVPPKVMNVLTHRLEEVC